MADIELHQCQCPQCVAGNDHPDRQLHRQMNVLFCRLDEQQRRWVAALESKKFGHGGDTLRRAHRRSARRYHPPRPAGTRCRLGRSPLRPHPQPRRRSAPGKKKDPQLVEALTELLEPVTGGDPMSQAKYVRRSLATLSAELAIQGHAACPSTLAELLRPLGYHLYVNVKRFTGPDHPDRDRQFRYLQEQIEHCRDRGPADHQRGHQEEGVDRRLQEPRPQAWAAVRGSQLPTTSARTPSTGPCPTASTTCWPTAATSASACRRIRRRSPSPASARGGRAWAASVTGSLTELLILADAGGSNGCRPRLWKRELQAFADRFGLGVDRGPLPDRGVEVEPDRASAVRADQHQLGR